MSGTHKKVHFGSFEFDFALQELRTRGLRVRLSVSQIRLLTMFLENPGALISREDIVSRLWKNPQSIDVSNGINTAVNRLRTNLCDDPTDPRYIETVVGLGYRFIAKVQPAEPVVVTAHRRIGDHVSAPIVSELNLVAAPVVEPEGAGQTAATLPAHSGLQQRNWMVATALIGVLAVSAIFLWHQQPSKVTASPLGSPPAAVRFRSVTFNDSDDRVTAAAMSPSGQMIAYSDRSGISVVWPDSGARRLLASPPQFQPSRIDWYLDGKRLAVSGAFENSYTSQTWQISLNGSAPRLLAEDSAAATISPDGKLMAFIHHQGTEIDIANADGSGPHKLAAAGERQTYRFLLWSRSGRFLVDESSIERHSSDAGASIARSTSPLIDLEAERQWNYETLDVSSSKRLAYVENICFDSGYLLQNGQLFYPDGAVSKSESVNRLMVVQTDPADGRFLAPPVLVQATGGDQAKSFSSSLDGKQSALIIGRNTADIFVGTLHPGRGLDGVTQISHHAFESYPHAWTPKDDAVLLENNSLGKDAIFEQRLDGSPPRMIAQLSNDAAMPEFTVDGKWILFLELSGKPSHVDAIFRVPANGGIPEEVPTTGEIDEFHCPALTGSCVLREAINRKEFVYYAFDPLKGMGRELARIAWEPALLGEWSLSPDGNTVAVAKHDSLHPGIRLIDLKATPTKISEIPVFGVGTLLGVTWDIHARGLFVETETEGRHYRLVYVGRAGDIKILRSTLTPIWAVPSHDGTKIAFPEITFRSNVWSSFQ